LTLIEQLHQVRTLAYIANAFCFIAPEMSRNHELLDALSNEKAIDMPASAAIEWASFARHCVG